MASNDKTYLCFDFGTARIGVAYGHASTGICTPLTTLLSRNRAPDWEAISTLMQTWQPSAVVVGVPVHMDGSPTTVTPRAERFARQIHGRYRVPVHSADERMSSRQAEAELKHLRQSGSRRRIQKTDIDSAAAVIILERWLQENAL